jgi:hypothetical protein
MWKKERASRGHPRLTLEELKAADDTDYADERKYDGSIRVIRVIRVIRGSSGPWKLDGSPVSFA